MANTIAHLAVAKELINQTEQYGGGAIVAVEIDNIK